MLKRFLVLTSPHLLIICFLLMSASCGNIASEAKTIHLTSKKSKDSLDNILKTINAETKTKQLEALYQKKVKYTGFNGCVLIAQKGQVLFKKAYGYTSFKTKEPIKLNTAFQLASASKPFTATAILMLMERGKLSLNDKVNKYIPNFPYPDINIHLLLTHRSGLNNYVYFGEPFCDSDKCYKGAPYDNNAVLEIMNMNKPVPYCPPNKRFGYCNTNYVILASIVEKVSGQSFHDFLRENIFVPLNMNNTWVRTPNSFNHHRNIAWGHKVSGQLENNTYADDVVGDKGIYSTVEDMLKWDQAFYTEKLLKRSTIEKAFTGYSREYKGNKNYGYGWRIMERGQGKKDIYHNGWWHGYNITFFRRPSNEITIIVLSNRDNKSAYLIYDILSIMDTKCLTTNDAQEEL